MGEKTGIAWCDSTWNPWWGCTKVSPGCAHCYAETWAKRYRFLVWGPESGRRVFGDTHWGEPVAWDRAAERAGIRRRVFCGSMCDVFEENTILGRQRERLWRLIRATPNLDWLLLTKRPENIAGMCDVLGADNVWLGTSVEDRVRAEERIPILLTLPAVVRFLSVEPMLGPVSFEVVNEKIGSAPVVGGIDWAIVGGESGLGARPLDVAWARALLAECRGAGIAPFIKQLGGYPDPRDDPAGWPEDLRIREFPR